MQPLGRLGDGGGLEHRTEGLQAFQVHRHSSITKLHVIQTFRHWTAYNILVHRAPTVSAGLTREGGPVGTVDRISGIHGKHPRRCVDLHRGHDSGGSLSAGLAVAGLSFQCWSRFVGRERGWGRRLTIIHGEFSRLVGVTDVQRGRAQRRLAALVARGLGGNHEIHP